MSKNTTLIINDHLLEGFDEATRQRLLVIAAAQQASTPPLQATAREQYLATRLLNHQAVDLAQYQRLGELAQHLQRSGLGVVSQASGQLLNQLADRLKTSPSNT